MNMKLVGLLVAVIVILLGVIVLMMNAKPTTPVGAPVTATAPIERPNPRGGSYKKTPPGEYEYTTPK